MTTKITRIFKWITVWGLEELCAILHVTRFVPVLRDHIGCQLATKAARLDMKWNTGVWTVPTQE